jgi:Tfp pilus assembly protein PilW
MSDLRIERYEAECEDNARIMAEPIAARLREAGWTVASSVWSREARQESMLIDNYEAPRGELVVVYHRDQSLPVLASLQAAVNEAGVDSVELIDGIRSFVAAVEQARLSTPSRGTLLEVMHNRQTFMAAYLQGGLLGDPGVQKAFRALPARVRLEIERADAETFLARFGA